MQRALFLFLIRQFCPKLRHQTRNINAKIRIQLKNLEGTVEFADILSTFVPFTTEPSMNEVFRRMGGAQNKAKDRSSRNGKNLQDTFKMYVQNGAAGG